MQARDVMTTRIVTVEPETSIQEVAKRLLTYRVSAVPVVDSGDRLLGIVSEGDLMRRPEAGTERHPSWWLSFVASTEEKAAAYAKAHGQHAKDVMTRNVISVSEDASLETVAELLERHHIKRVPVVRDGKLIGIVSRADLLRGLIARQAAPAPTVDDRTLRAAVDKALSEADVRHEFLSIVVSGGQVHLWGAVESDAEKRAAAIAAENVPGVKGVRDDINVIPASVRRVMWAE